MEQDNLEIKETVEANEETKKQEEYNNFIAEEVEKRMNENGEVQKIKEELEANKSELEKFRKEIERINKKIAIRKNNIELLESKIKIKQLEINVAVLQEM